MITICIGRKDVGKDDITVPADSKMVGQHHAQITINEETGKVLFKEIDAKNGSFLNGHRIASSEINKGDELWLGENGPLGFKVPVDDIISNYKIFFVEEFGKIIDKYEEYISRKEKIQKKLRRKYQTPKMVVGLVVALAALAACIVIKDNGIRITIMSIGSLSGALLAFVQPKVGQNEEILNLDLEYDDYYVCPRCGARFALTKHWKFYQKNGCPNPRCKAKFMKNE